MQSQSQSQIAETNSAFADQVIAAEKRIVELENSLVKAKQALSRTVITAPVDGSTVLSLATKTIGGVVSPAERIA